MREIKFRFWSKLLDQFVLPDDKILAGCFKDDKMVVMQYTGLKDKNGKEIFEGDIVTDIKGDKRVVEYIDNGFWCSYPNGDHYFPADGHREIIGDIYQNPELLS
jgi:hypothetical protein